MKALKKIGKHQPDVDDYSSFDQLDGRHPWQEQVPEGLVLYPVRLLDDVKVSYFNFDLAKEMGLISPDHPHRLNKKLQDKIVATFGLRILNEYDQKHRLKVPAHKMKKHPYMATRYLQLQHSDKTGRTSGDGRCIWNGIVAGRNEIWDVSSRGTGVTSLAPGAVQAGKPLRSGNNSHGYGCGMAEIDELYGASLLAEVFHRNGIPTERVLTILDLGKGMGIGVRAAKNLLRPAHMFLFLKQNRLKELKRAVHYFIDRQWANKVWSFRPESPLALDKMLDEVSQSFARFAATLERDYIFAWLDWDGDNVLADAGIIDYGSVRQFGLRHDQYRYDDVDRFSTNLNEQKLKARDMVQTFAQLVDYLKTGTKKPWKRFAKANCLRDFDSEFKHALLDRFLYQVGYPTHLRRILLGQHRPTVEKFFATHLRLERIKTKKRLHKVADGVHRPAILNMRDGLAAMAAHVDSFPKDIVPLIDDFELFDHVLSSQAKGRDRQLAQPLRQLLRNWQRQYLKVFRSVSTPENADRLAEMMCQRSGQINDESRITGNALIHVVDEILKQRKKGLSDKNIQVALESMIEAQTLNPDFKPVSMPSKTQNKQSATTVPLVGSLLSVVHGFREDI